jgi:glycosyltransferase involved in cell wall biosynthesis
MISVLITYHNEKELLTECIKSFVSQEEQLIDEILIFDDASEYPAIEYISDFKVRVIRSEQNVGPGHARNILANEALSTYIHFHDADDLVTENWSSKVAEYIHNIAADVIITEVMSVKEDVVVSNAVMQVDELLNGINPIDFAILGSVLVPSTILRKSLFLKCGGFKSWTELPQSEDYDLHLRMFMLYPHIVVINEPLVIQRIRNNSHSSDSMDQCFISALNVMKDVAQRLDGKHYYSLALRSARIASYFYQKNNHSDGDFAYKISKGFRFFVVRNDRNLLFNILYFLTSLKTAEKVASKFRNIKNHNKWRFI